MRSRVLAAAALAVSMVPLAACGGDDEATLEEWMAVVCPAAPSEQMFDQFFTDHPEPTLEDWAGFLPGVAEQMHTFADLIVDTDHPDDIDEQLVAASEAMHVVAQNFADGAAAAEAGDADRFAEIERQNQDVDVPAMEQAMVGDETGECPEQGE